MLDFYITEALITERLLDNYVSIDIVDEANLIYEGVDGPYQVKRDGGISIKILGRAEGTIFDGEHELNVNFLVIEKDPNITDENIEVIIGKDMINYWESMGYRSLYNSWENVW